MVATSSARRTHLPLSSCCTSSTKASRSRKVPLTRQRNVSTSHCPPAIDQHPPCLYQPKRLEQLTLVITFDEPFNRQDQLGDELLAVSNLIGAVEQQDGANWLPEVAGSVCTVHYQHFASFLLNLGLPLAGTVCHLIVYLLNGPNSPPPSLATFARLALIFPNVRHLSLWLEPTNGNVVTYWQHFCTTLHLLRRLTQLQLHFRHAEYYGRFDLGRLPVANLTHLTLGHFIIRTAQLVSKLNANRLTTLTLYCDETEFYWLQETLQERPHLLANVQWLAIKLLANRWTRDDDEQFHQPFEHFEHFFQYLPKMVTFRLQYTALVAFTSPLVRSVLLALRTHSPQLLDLTLLNIIICRLTGATHLAVPSIRRLTIRLSQCTEFFTFFRHSLSLHRPSAPVAVGAFWRLIFTLFPNIIELNLIGAVYEADIVCEQLFSYLRTYPQSHSLIYLRTYFTPFQVVTE